MSAAGFFGAIARRMYMDFIAELAEKRNNFVLIGEAGSGKTEIALNLALALKSLNAGKQVHLFDMDQTKPMLRARDSAEVVESEGIVFHCQQQYLDSPVVVSGVIEALNNPGYFVILDVGGGSHGSHMIGQFSRFLTNDLTEVLYIINPYRPWSRTREDINETVSRVLGAAGISATSLVANPNLGVTTELEDILTGIKRIEELLPDVPISFAAVLEKYSADVSGKTDYPVFPVKLNTPLEWMRPD